MELEELELERKSTTITQTSQLSEQEVKPKLSDLPRLEDLLKSEKEIVKPELKGLKRIEDEKLTENKTFTRKADEKKQFAKRRVKTIGVIYSVCLVFLLGFAIFNLATLVGLQNDYITNANTIQNRSDQVSVWEENATDPSLPSESAAIALNLPRDYADDKQELTFFDRVAILFKNLFG